MNEYAPDFISLIDDEDNEVNFEIIDSFEENDGEQYLALVPIFENPEDALIASNEFVIMKTEEVDGEEMYVAIGDDDPDFERLAEIFEKRIEEKFEAEDDEDDLQ